MLSSLFISLTLSWTDITGYYHQYVYPEKSMLECQTDALGFMHQPDGDMTHQTATCDTTVIYVK